MGRKIIKLQTIPKFSCCLLFFVLCLSCTGLQAANIQQNKAEITLKEKHISFAALFKEIKAQTGLIVFYNNTILDDRKEIDVDFSKKTD